MKKYLLTAFVTMGAFALSNAQELKITNYDNNTVNYGTVKKGSDGKRTIEIQNVGDKPLIISNIGSSCGCTVPKWPTTPIAPGKKEEIMVTYNTAINGSFSKGITVTSNDVKNSNLYIRVTGVVEN